MKWPPTHAQSIMISLAVAVLTSPAHAQSDFDKFNDSWRVYFGGFWPEVESTLGINGDVRPPGPPVDIEDVLGVEDSKGTAWGGIAWHISRRNSLEFEYFALNRGGGRSGLFTPPIQIGDTFI